MTPTTTPDPAGVDLDALERLARAAGPEDLLEWEAEGRASVTAIYPLLGRRVPICKFDLQWGFQHDVGLAAFIAALNPVTALHLISLAKRTEAAEARVRELEAVRPVSGVEERAKFNFEHRRNAWGGDVEWDDLPPEARADEISAMRASDALLQLEQMSDDQVDGLSDDQLLNRVSDHMDRFPTAFQRSNP